MSDTPFPRALYLASQVRELDRRAIQDNGIPGYALMCQAGRACLQALRKRWPHARRIVILCGAGNNAGDGYVVGRLAREVGLAARILYLADPQKLRGDAETAWRDAFAEDLEIQPYDSQRLTPADVIVDALLGTGLQRAVSGAWADTIAEVNVAEIPVLAVDIPSGLSADTGAVMGVAVRADLTVSFIGLKQGLFSGQARHHCGEIRFDDLGVPKTVYEDLPPSAYRYDGEDLPHLLPARSKTAHKGDFGHVLIVGGDDGMGGAARLAGEAAVRVGAGLVSVATRPGHASVQAAARPEIMFHGIDHPDQLGDLAARANVLALGPGLGRKQWGREMLDWTLAQSLPIVIDADGLNLLAGRELQPGPRVLTPHPGEAGRLLGCGAAEVENDRFRSLQAIQQQYRSVIVLKGAGTLVSADANEAPSVCQSGNPGMATGGMGDVLTGVIAGLLAQGLSEAQAAHAGVWLHGAAADRAAVDGERGLLASDLFPHLRRLVNGL